MSNFQHCGLCFTPDHIQAAHENVNREPIQSAWMFLSTQDVNDSVMHDSELILHAYRYKLTSNRDSGKQVIHARFNPATALTSTAMPPTLMPSSPECARWHMRLKWFAIMRTLHRVSLLGKPTMQTLPTSFSIRPKAAALSIIFGWGFSICRTSFWTPMIALKRVARFTATPSSRCVPKRVSCRSRRWGRRSQLPSSVFRRRCTGLHGRSRHTCGC